MSLNHDTGHASLDALTAANGEHTPDLVATNDSPATPVSVTPAPDVKIDLDYQEQESDVRHEPIPIKPIDSIDDFNHQSMSTISQLGSPPDSASIPIHPPSGTPPPLQGDLLPDVKMAEQRSQPTPNGINGAHTNGTVQDVVMGDATPLATPRLAPDMSMDSVVAADTSSQSPLVHHLQDDDDSKPPPAKRARMYSEADRDRDSLVHSATPPPASAAVSDAASPAPPPPSSVPPTTAGLSTTFTVQQHRFLTSTIRSLKKQKDASPFLRPVDPVALNIPHYPSIIKHPMDLLTVERKLASSNPQKPDSNHNNPRYLNVDEFIADVRLIFANCVTFNGPDHAITAMGKRVEEIFDKQLKHLPTAVEHSKPTVKKVTTPPPPPPPPAPAPAPAKKTPAVRRPSTSFPVIRRNDQNEAVGRPKREIHPPPPKDLPYAEPVKKSKKGKRVKDDGTMEQLRFCGKILTDFHKKQHYNIAHPFYEPVDWVKLEIPSYPKVIRKPMDLSTMRKKLENNEYPNASKFFDDFKLMIRNCFTFNPVGTPVNMAGVELQRLFDEKWKNLPPLHPVEPSEDEEEEDEEELQRQRAIADIESQIETMRENLDALKSKPVKEKKKKEKERPVIASTSKVPPKPPKPSTKKASTKKKPIPDDDVLSFDQKKDLSESIGKLDGAKLEKVIQIIHEGVPEIRDSTEEIELEIDLLPAAVLTKLYNFVIRPMRQQNAPKRGGRTGKGTGTGGLKRKSMDEDLEAEKIRQLEERMALFEKKEGGGVAPLPTHREVESEQSSDSSSDDSSGSDSD